MRLLVLALLVPLSGCMQGCFSPSGSTWEGQEYFELLEGPLLLDSQGIVLHVPEHPEHGAAVDELWFRDPEGHAVRYVAPSNLALAVRQAIDETVLRLTVLRFLENATTLVQDAREQVAQEFMASRTAGEPMRGDGAQVLFFEAEVPDAWRLSELFNETRGTSSYQWGLSYPYKTIQTPSGTLAAWQDGSVGIEADWHHLEDEDAVIAATYAELDAVGLPRPPPANIQPVTPRC